jgi:hypothetical protein
MSVQTVLSDLAEIQNNPVGGRLAEAGVCGGKVRYAFAEYVAPDGNVSAGSLIKMLRLPKGARLLAMSYLVADPGQSTDLTLQAGDDDSGGAVANRYLKEAAINDYGDLGANPPEGYVIPFSGGANHAAAGAMAKRKVPSECWLTVTTGGAALVSGKHIQAHIFYALD